MLWFSDPFIVSSLIFDSREMQGFGVLQEILRADTWRYSRSYVNAIVYAAKDALRVSRMLADLGYATGNKPLQIAEVNSACTTKASSGLK
jgi:hypothetical protein